MATRCPKQSTTLRPLPAGTRLASFKLFINPNDPTDQAEYRLAHVEQTGRLILVSLSGRVVQVSQTWAREVMGISKDERYTWKDRMHSLVYSKEGRLEGILGSRIMSLTQEEAMEAVRRYHEGGEHAS